MGTGIQHGDIKFSDSDLKRIAKLLEHNSDKATYRIFMDITPNKCVHRCEVEDFITAFKQQRHRSLK